MAKIVATGKYLTDRITVEVTQEDGTLVITMDGNESPELQKHLAECIENQPAMGGTYFPEPDSMLAAFNVLNLKKSVLMVTLVKFLMKKTPYIDERHPEKGAFLMR